VVHWSEVYPLSKGSSHAARMKHSNLLRNEQFWKIIEPFFVRIKQFYNYILQTSLTTYKSTRLHIPVALNLQQHHCENLKSRVGYTAYKYFLTIFLVSLQCVQMFLSRAHICDARSDSRMCTDCWLCDLKYPDFQSVLGSFLWNRPAISLPCYWSTELRVRALFGLALVKSSTFTKNTDPNTSDISSTSSLLAILHISILSVDGLNVDVTYLIYV
jgi:hypothetical protein